MSDDLPRPALADALTAHTHALCRHLEDGMADILDLVTPTTAELLHWWFGRKKVVARGHLNFHALQRQAVLNTIVAQEVLAATTLKDLYQQVAPQVLRADARYADMLEARRAHPQYCLGMANAIDQTWVLHALLIWQLLNRMATVEAGWTDARFTHNFLIAAHGTTACERLADMVFGQTHRNMRNFSDATIVRFAELLIPPAYRERVFAFMHDCASRQKEAGYADGSGLIMICDRNFLAGMSKGTMAKSSHPDAPSGLQAAKLPPSRSGRTGSNNLRLLDRRWLSGNVLTRLAALSNLMLFAEAPPDSHECLCESAAEAEWQRSVSVLAARKGRCFVQIDFAATRHCDMNTDEQRKCHLPHVITTPV